MPDEYAYLGNCCYSYECERYMTGCEKCENIHAYPNSWFFDQAARTVRMKERAYSGLSNLYFVSPEFNIKKAQKSFLLKNRNLITADWGIDLNTYKIRDTKRIRDKYGIPKGKKIILTVGKYSDERKGIKKYFAEAAKRIQDEDTIFVNIGFDGNITECPSNFLPIPYVSDQNELAELFSCADLFVITSIADTMPFVCLISLACGTPICSFNTSGLPYIFDEKSGKSIPEGDIGALVKAIENTSKKTNEVESYCRMYAESRYSDKDFYERVIQPFFL